MQNGIRALGALALTAALLTGCGQRAAAPEEQAPPARVQHLSPGLSRIVLSKNAAARLGIDTAAVRRQGRGREVIPYSAVVYAGDGRAWAYTNPEPLVFVRERIDVVRIDGQRALLSRGPRPGTRVVTVGAEELFGTEFEFEE